MIKATRPPLRRMFTIDNEIRKGNYPNKKVLAQILEVNPKTVQRDIVFMKDRLKSPLSYCFKQRGYYYTKKDYFLPINAFSEKEIFAFKVAQRVLQTYKNTSYFNEITKVLDRVLSYLPENVLYDQIESSFSFDTGPISSFSQDTLEIINKAIANLQQVKVLYHSFNSNSIKERLWEPYHIFNRQNKWYLIAYCHEQNQPRTFTIGRILSLEKLNKKFPKPKFCIETYKGNSFALERGNKTYNVELHISKEQSKWIKERKWHKTQKTRMKEDGSMIFTMKTNSLNEVKRWVLQYGAEIEVLKPGELKKLIKDEIKKMAEIYK